MNGLEALQARYLDEQRARATAIVKTAHEGGQSMLAQAEADAGAIAADARREGEATATLDTDRDWTAARRHARAIVLAARRQAYEELLQRAEQAIRSDRRYPALQRQIADDGRRRLGPGTEVVVDPDVVESTRKHRRIRWSLQAEVEQRVQRCGSEVEALWR